MASTPKSLRKVESRPRVSVMFCGCVIGLYHSVGTLVPVDGVIDSRKYTSRIPLYGQLYCEAFFLVNCNWIVQDDNAQVHCSRNGKINGELQKRRCHTISKSDYH